MTNVAPVLESRKGECLKNSPMSNDEMIKSPLSEIRSKANSSDFGHSSFFRHSSLEIRHLRQDSELT